MNYDEIEACIDINLLKQAYDKSKAEFDKKREDINQLKKFIDTCETEIKQAKNQINELKQSYSFVIEYEQIGIRIAELYVIPHNIYVESKSRFK